MKAWFKRPGQPGKNRDQRAGLVGRGLDHVHPVASCIHCDGSGVLNVTSWPSGERYPSACHACETGKMMEDIIDD